MIRRFNRFELKYILPLAQCARLIDELKEQIAPDRHGGSAGYSVVSLYYDSPDLECFWSKIEGVKYRRKLRLRIYPEAELEKVSSCAVEIKQRINKTVQKRRLALPLDRAVALCEGSFDPSFDRHGLDAQDAQVANEVTMLRHLLDLRPTAVTSYWRRAFDGHNENAGLRVTFDSHVAARMHALRVHETAHNHLILPDEWCIMEVKANDRVPQWLAWLLARHGCQLSRVSKYCAGVARVRSPAVLPLALSPGVQHPLPITAARTSSSGLPEPPHG